MGCFRAGHLPSVEDRTWQADDLTSADRGIPDWLAQIAFLGKPKLLLSRYEVLVY